MPQLMAMKGFGIGNHKYQMDLLHEAFDGQKGLYFHFHNNCRFPTDPELNAEKLFVSVVDMVPSKLASRIP